MTSTITNPSKSKKEKKHPPLNSGGVFEGILYLFGLLFLGFLGLSIFAFTRPLTRAANNISYRQDGNYFYSATGTPGVYDKEMIRTGEPVFPKLTCFLNIGLTYTILGSQLQNLSGSHQMYARVADQQSGWQRTIPMVPQTAFTGNSYFAMATLDLCQLEMLVNMVEKETGLRTNIYTVEIIDNASFTANASGQAITDTFDPVLAFKYDKVHLYLANNDNEIDSMHTTKEGLISSSNIQANILNILGLDITVGFIRIFALAGLGILVSGLVMIGLFVFNRARQSEETLIRLRYGSILMDVYEQSLNPTLPIIDVASINDLAKMAERQNTMILHMSLNFIQYYLVQGNGVVYRYTINAEKEIPAKKTIKQEIPDHIANTNEYIHNTPQLIQLQPMEYVINTGKISVEYAYPEETEMLRKIRI